MITPVTKYGMTQIKKPKEKALIKEGYTVTPMYSPPYPWSYTPLNRRFAEGRKYRKEYEDET